MVSGGQERTGQVGSDGTEKNFQLQSSCSRIDLEYLGIWNSHQDPPKTVFKLWDLSLSFSHNDLIIIKYVSLGRRKPSGSYKELDRGWVCKLDSFQPADSLNARQNQGWEKEKAWDRCRLCLGMDIHTKFSVQNLLHKSTLLRMWVHNMFNNRINLFVTSSTLDYMCAQSPQYDIMRHVCKQVYLFCS